VLAYLFSRFPVVSQTFCDTEMLALEASGHALVIGSLNPPPNSFRHERLAQLKAEVIYPPPGVVLDMPLHQPPDDPVWQAMAALATEHERQYGSGVKAQVRARNAWHFAREFRKRGVTHVHVHFANRATHTALFLKKAGFTYSFTAHAQDFMVDLANDDLLREMIREATFTAAVSDYSRALLVNICPDAADRIHRVYNGIDASRFPAAHPGDATADGTPSPLSTSSPQSPTSPLPLRLISIGRLIDFKGFPVLIEAVASLRDRKIPVRLQIIGEGPQRAALEAQIDRLHLHTEVHLCGVLSQEEIKKELAASHAFALACLTDAKGATDILPTVILEAMATGLPVVSTTLAGVPEMVIHGETGLLAIPGDVASLAACLTTMAKDPDLRGRLGQAGFQRVQDVFALNKTAGHLASLFPAQSAKAVAAGERSHRIPVSTVLCLLDSPSAPDPALLREIVFLSHEPGVTLLASRLTQPVAVMEFLPDATVLEAAWRSHPALAAKAEALRPEAGPVDGERFYLNARRAVHLATQIPVRRWHKIHAVRAHTMLLAWMLHRLTGLPASATIEATHHESRAVLGKLLPAFGTGSNSDAKLKSPWPDLFKLQAPLPPKRLLGLKLPAPPAVRTDPGPVWQTWLKQH
jgi:glycosyltransferase involved in cell wall biosynthesis